MKGTHSGACTNIILPLTEAYMALSWLTGEANLSPTESVFSQKHDGLNDPGYNNKPALGVPPGETSPLYGRPEERWWECTVH